MQLKDLGSLIDVSQKLNQYINSGITGNKTLASVLEGLSNAQKISVVSQLDLTEKQKLGILSTAGLTGAELRAIATTNALSASQDQASISTENLSNAFKGVGVKFKQFGTQVKGIGTSLLSIATTHPILSGIAVAIGVVTAKQKLHELLFIGGYYHILPYLSTYYIRVHPIF